jgi:predicted hydrocarbon binding protein
MKEVLSVEEKRRLVVLNSIFMTIQKTLEASIGKSSAKVLYTAGEEFGHKYMEILIHENMKTTIQDLLVELEATDFIKAQFNPDNMSFHVSNSPIALSYGENEEPVCHFLSGFFTGIATIYYEKDLTYKETHCKSVGDTLCIFELVNKTGSLSEGNKNHL